MPPDEPTDEERQEEIPEANDMPSQAADDRDNDGDDSAASIDHPSTDTDVDAQELYDESEPDDTDEPSEN